MSAKVNEGSKTRLAKVKDVTSANNTEIKSMDLIRASHALRPVAIALILLLSIMVICLIYVPWQQSVTGYGRVTIFSPMDRPQNIEAQIPGRLVKWTIFEGQEVREGDVIAELSDIDSKFLDTSQTSRLENQREFLINSLNQSISRQEALSAQLNDLTGSRNVAIPAADQRAKQGIDRLKLAEQNLEQSRQAVTTSELNLKRLQDLFDKGLRSKRDLELAELDIVTARTRLESMVASLDVAKKDLLVVNYDKDRVVNDTSAQLNSIRASLASVGETIAKTKSDLQKLDVDISNVSRRSEQRIVRAPRDGRLARVMKTGQGETVKAGDVLAVLVPKTTDQAVELWLTDFDAPLVSVGRQVRLNFAGWPAIQFVGWPSVAVGTFAGKVKVMDAVDDGKSRFRIIVVPDEDAIKAGKEERWPPLDQLRPGAEVNGWIMLDTVSLGFELWRQFNAFPPTVKREPIGEKSKQMGDSKDKKEDKKSSDDK